MNTPHWCTKLLLGSLLFVTLALGSAHTSITNDTLLAQVNPNGSLGEAGGS
ncbi:MAG: hypothetical protein AAGF95_30640 [Chloroflexota bacterium]